MVLRAIFRRIRRRAFLLSIRLGNWFAIHCSGAESIRFVCNVCGNRCRVVCSALSREQISCGGCGSSVRYRSVIHSLLTGLGITNAILKHIKSDKSITGVGMTDSGVYTKLLSKKFSYTNTFYHREPKLDILDIEGHQLGYADFIICSDVFEHVNPPISLAFQNLFLLLRQGGLLVLTVPLVEHADAKEYFPALNEYHIEFRDDKPVLVNITTSGQREVFHTLTFHEGEGQTLVTRDFSKEWAFDELRKAGFTDIRLMDAEYPDLGIVWRRELSVPILAWKPVQVEG